MELAIGIFLFVILLIFLVLSFLFPHIILGVSQNNSPTKEENKNETSDSSPQSHEPK